MYKKILEKIIFIIFTLKFKLLYIKIDLCNNYFNNVIIVRNNIRNLFSNIQSAKKMYTHFKRCMYYFSKLNYRGEQF